MNSAVAPIVLWLPVLVLVASGLVWWVARRDLTSRADAERARVQAEWDAVRSAAEALIGDLERRAADAQERMTALEGLLTQMAQPAGADHSASNAVGEASPDARYAEVTQLASSGLDPADIARQTGLSRGEVELVLSLRARRML